MDCLPQAVDLKIRDGLAAPSLSGRTRTRAPSRFPLQRAASDASSDRPQTAALRKEE